MCLLVAPLGVAKTAVLDASESVFRVWVGLPMQEPPPAHVAGQLQQQGYVSTFIAGNELVIFQQGGSNYLLASSGSSFGVASDRLATNHHVIETLLDNSAARGFLVTNPGGRLRPVPVEVIWHDDKRDLAILKTSGLSFAPLEFSSQESIYPSAPAWSIGFPGDSDDVSGGLKDATGYFSPKIRLGSLASQHDRNGYSVWEHNADVSAGNSGGPLVNECGQVVGVNTFVHTRNQAVLFAVAGAELYSALDTLGIPYSVSPFECSGANHWIIPVLAAFAALLLALALYMVHLKGQVQQGNFRPSSSQLLNNLANNLAGNKHRDKQERHQWQVDENGREHRWDPINGLIYRDEEESEEKHQQEEPPAPQPDPRHREPIPVQVRVNNNIVASGLLQVGGVLTIGRAPDNQLVVANSLVSGSHLTLRYVNHSTIEVADQGSTNGTFVNGQKTSRASVSYSDSLTLAKPAIEVVMEWPNIDTIIKVMATLRPMAPGLPTIRVEEGQLVTIGYHGANHYVIKSEVLSSQHCVLTMSRNGELEVTDNQSTNGTYVDHMQQKVTKASVPVGSRLYLATQQIAFERVE